MREREEEGQRQRVAVHTSAVFPSLQHSLSQSAMTHSPPWHVPPGQMVPSSMGVIRQSADAPRQNPAGRWQGLVGSGVHAVP